MTINFRSNLVCGVVIKGQETYTLIPVSVDVPGPLLGRGALWLNSCKRPLSLFILGGRIREGQTKGKMA